MSQHTGPLLHLQHMRRTFINTNKNKTRTIVEILDSSKNEILGEKKQFTIKGQNKMNLCEKKSL